MQVLIWSGMFLVMTISVSAVELVGMIGFPIAPDVHMVVVGLACLVIVLGIAMLVVAPQTNQSLPER